jgi:hypothetical protein
MHLYLACLIPSSLPPCFMPAVPPHVPFPLTRRRSCLPASPPSNVRGRPCLGGLPTGLPL